MNIQMLINCSFTFLYAKYSARTKKTFAPFGWEAFSGLSEILRYGLPNAAMFFFEWGSAEIQMILIGIAGVEQLAAATVCVSFMMLMRSIPIGFGFATSSVVGNALGAGLVKKAKTFAKVSTCILLTSIVIVVSICLILRKQIAFLYIQDAGVVEIISVAILIFGAS